MIDNENLNLALAGMTGHLSPASQQIALAHLTDAAGHSTQTLALLDAATSNPGADVTPLLDHYARHDDDLLRLIAAEHPATSSNVLAELASDDEDNVRKAAVSTRGTLEVTLRILEKLASSTNAHPGWAELDYVSAMNPGLAYNHDVVQYASALVSTTPPTERTRPTERQIGPLARLLREHIGAFENTTLDPHYAAMVLASVLHYDASSQTINSRHMVRALPHLTDPATLAKARTYVDDHITSEGLDLLAVQAPDTTAEELADILTKNLARGSTMVVPPWQISQHPNVSDDTLERVIGHLLGQVGKKTGAPHTHALTQLHNIVRTHPHTAALISPSLGPTPSDAELLDSFDEAERAYSWIGRHADKVTLDVLEQITWTMPDDPNAWQLWDYVIKQHHKYDTRHNPPSIATLPAQLLQTYARPHLAAGIASILDPLLQRYPALLQGTTLATTITHSPTGNDLGTCLDAIYSGPGIRPISVPARTAPRSAHQH